MCTGNGAFLVLHSCSLSLCSLRYKTIYYRMAEKCNHSLLLVPCYYWTLCTVQRSFQLSQNLSVTSTRWHYHHRLSHTHTHTHISFNQPTFLRLLQVRSVPISKLLGIVVGKLLQARCPSCSPNNSIKALSMDDSVPDLGLHAAAMLPRKISNTVTFAWTAVTMTVFLTWRQHAATTLSSNHQCQNTKRLQCTSYLTYSAYRPTHSSLKLEMQDV